MKPTTRHLAAASLLLAAACTAGADRTQRAATDGAGRVLATVNGVALDEFDLELVLARMPGRAPGHEGAQAAVLQTLVREELVYQEAVRLGLDRDPEYRRGLEALEAQVRAFRRKEMAARYRTHARAQAGVTEAEARAFFQENAALVRTRFHVLQLAARGDRAGLVAAQEELASGVPFEEVAARRLPALPAGVRPPWDLGMLAWHQLPGPWLGVVDRMAPGQVSAIIEGESGRAWVIKLAASVTDPAVGFETERERIVEILRQRKAGDGYARALSDLAGRATVVYASR